MPSDQIVGCRLLQHQTKELSIRQYNVPVEGENLYQRVEHKENTIRLSLEYRY